MPVPHRPAGEFFKLGASQLIFRSCLQFLFSPVAFVNPAFAFTKLSIRLVANSPVIEQFLPYPEKYWAHSLKPTNQSVMFAGLVE